MAIVLGVPNFRIFTVYTSGAVNIRLAQGHNARNLVGIQLNSESNYAIALHC